MFAIKREFITLPDKLVEIIRVYPEDRVRNIDGIHSWLGTDTLLRKNGYLYFCVKIDEAQIVKE